MYWDVATKYLDDHAPPVYIVEIQTPQTEGLRSRQAKFVKIYLRKKKTPFHRIYPCIVKIVSHISIHDNLWKLQAERVRLVGDKLVHFVANGVLGLSLCQMCWLLYRGGSRI